MSFEGLSDSRRVWEIVISDLGYWILDAGYRVLDYRNVECRIEECYRFNLGILSTGFLHCTIFNYQ